MIFGGILVGVIIMIVMISMAVNKKSDKKVRFAAVIALGVMIFSVIICIIIVFTDTAVVQDPSALIVGQPVETKEAGNDIWIMLILIAFLLAIFVTVAVLARREGRKQLSLNANAEKPVSNW